MQRQFDELSITANSKVMAMMNEYEFDLIYALPHGQTDPELHLDALYEAGCDDALIGTGVDGRIALAFTREAASAEEAVKSAKADVERAIDGAQLIEVKPDIVGASEIAQLAKCSRQNVQKQLAKATITLRPSHTLYKAQLFHLAKIRIPLKEQTSLSIPDTIFDISEIALKENQKLLEA